MLTSVGSINMALLTEGNEAKFVLTSMQRPTKSHSAFNKKNIASIMLVSRVEGGVIGVLS